MPKKTPKMPMKGTHKMPGGKPMKDSDMPKKMPRYAKGTKGKGC
jgi:hypothetical protein